MQVYFYEKNNLNSIHFVFYRTFFYLFFFSRTRFDTIEFANTLESRMSDIKCFNSTGIAHKDTCTVVVKIYLKVFVKT